MITTYQDNQLFIASSRVNHDGEALLFRVLEKVYEIEALAMLRLQKLLKPAQYQQLLRRIAELKSRSIHFTENVDNKRVNNGAGLQYYCRDSENLSENHESKWSQSSTSRSNPETPHNTDAGDTAIVLTDRAQSLLEQSLLAKAQGWVRGMMNSDKGQYLSQGNNDPTVARYYPLIAFNQRGKVAGVAYLERWEIRLNPILLVENSDQFIDEVIAHEYAHLLVFSLFGKVQPHGKEWRMMMTKIMGLPANRTHTFNTDNSTTRQYQRFTYRCKCKEHALTSIRHNRIQAGTAQYHCKSCGSALHYIAP